MRLIDGIPIFGTNIDEGALKQIKNCANNPDVRHCALMADHHKGYAVPIGGVVAYEDAISPSGVGYDIGCGNKAVRLDISPRGAQDVKKDISLIMDEVFKTISFGIGRKNNEPVDHPLFESPIWTLPAVKDLKKLAQDQLGTVGSGNHYVDIFEDEEGRIWIGVHFGSRGLGHKTATFFLNEAGAKNDMDADPCVIPWKTDLGQDYILSMRLAGEYAYAGRDWVCQKVADIIGAKIVEEVHNHHNFAWQEEHNGKFLWVVRKGATPAFPGQRGFIGGSMAENAVIVEGIEDPSNIFTLNSTIHGAGRIMGRREATGKFKSIEGARTQIHPGKVSQEMMYNWVQKANVELRGAGVDESPDCYKRLPEVLAVQPGIKIIHTLRPLGVAMAGAKEYDPYKD